jgi:hypothetical protein
MCSFWKIQTDSDISHLSSLMLHTAVVSTVWSFFAGGKWPVNIIPYQKHLLWWEYNVYCNVLLGPSIKPLGQSIKQGRLYSQTHSLHCLKATEESYEWHNNVFEMERKWLELDVLCFPPLTSFPLHPVLTGIKLTAEKNTIYMGKHLEIHL